MADEKVEKAEPEVEVPFEKAKPAENPRNQIMREIVKASNIQLELDAKETFPVVDDDGNVVQTQAQQPEPPEEPDEPEETEEEVQPEIVEKPELKAEPPKEEPKAVAKPDPNSIDPNADYPVTIDGKQMMVKGAKIIDAGFRTFQKETAADHRLQLATAMLDEAKKTAQPPVTGAVDASKLAEAIQLGTSEQATEAVRTLQSSVTPEMMQTFMMREMPQYLNAQLAFREAANFAKTEYADLLADPYLKDLFLMKEDEARKAGDTRPPAELYKSIGDGLRSHFNKPKPSPTIESRREAKAKAPAAPKLAASRIDGGEQVKPKTTTEIIAGMRARRGQGSLTKH